MGFLEITNRGNGFIGEVGSGWRINYNTSPVLVSEGAGAIGSLSFSARCDHSTRFTIDNAVNVRHYLDDQTNRWLSTFDISLEEIETNGEFAQFSGTSRISELDVQRQPSANPSGLYQRTFEFPKGITYVANAITYTVQNNPTVYDVTTSDNYYYVLASGSHGGEVVYRFGAEGWFYQVFAVYSDATDLASPQSRYITYVSAGTGEVHVAQVSADRVKRFAAQTGAFLGQYGTAGTGNGQFDTISGIASRSTQVFVLDSALGRVQRFSSSGVYQIQWGTQGTTEGNFVFKTPHAIAVPRNGRSVVYIGDMNGRIREYTTDGVFFCEPVGGYDFISSTSTSPLKLNVPFGIAIEGDTPTLYVRQEGHVWKYNARTLAGYNFSNFKYGIVANGEWDTGTGYRITTGIYGILMLINGNDLEQWSGTLKSIQAYLLYYIALASPNFPIRFMALADAKTDTNNIPSYLSSGYPTWRMSVWRAICELCAATGNAVFAFDDFVAFSRRDDSRVALRLPDDVSPEPVKLNSRSAPRSVRVGNWNAESVDLGWSSSLVGGVAVYSPGAVMYSAEADGDKTFHVDVNSLDYITVNQGTFPEVLIDPVPAGFTVNPFTNPSITTDLNSMGWYVPSGTATMTRDTAVFHSAPASAKLTFNTAPATLGGYLAQRVDVVQGKMYDFRVMARVTGANQEMYLVIDWRNGAGTHMGFTIGNQTTVTSSGWSEMKSDDLQTPFPGAAFAWVGVWVHPAGRLWLNGEALYTDSYSNGPLLAPTPPQPYVRPGEYLVYDSNGVLVTAEDWTNYGGFVRAELGDNPGDIRLTIKGPGIEIPGTERPYKIGTVANHAALSVIGGGLATRYEEYELGTGVSEFAARTEYISIDSPFIVNAGTAYTEAAWTGYTLNPGQAVSFTFRNHLSPTWVSSSTGLGGTTLLTNMMFRYQDALYMIESVSSNNAFTTINAYRHTPCDTSSGGVTHDYSFESVWNGRTAAEFDAYWSSRSPQDFTIAPLENPFGIGASWIDDTDAVDGAPYGSGAYGSGPYGG